MKYLCPIILKNDTVKSFNIASDIEVRKMTLEEKGHFFGLKRIDFGFATNFPLGFIGFNQFFPTEGEGPKGRCPYSSLLQRGHFDGVSDILASGFLIAAKIPDNGRMEFAENINLLFKLLRPTSTGIYLLFQESQTDVGFHSPQVIHGPYDYLNINGGDIKKLQAMYQLLREIKNERFKLCCNLYCRALLGDKNAFDMRFLLLTMALETLYLSNNQELNFRLRLFVSRTLYKDHLRRNELFNEIKNIYETRSEIVHKGHSKRLNSELFSKLTEIVRLSLTSYLYRPESFDDLENACLK